MPAAREVLQRVAELLGAIVLKLQPQVLLQRMQEFDSSEVMQRVALAAIHANAQLRLQLAVNYAGNNVVAVVIGSVQMLLQRYEGPTVAAARGGDLEAALALLQGGQLPPDGWDYVLYGLEVCLHILSHWSATKISLKTKADVMDSSAAPLVLVQCGLVDVLVEIIDPAPAGFQRNLDSERAGSGGREGGWVDLFSMELPGRGLAAASDARERARAQLNSQPPSEVVQKATETLQALASPSEMRPGRRCPV
ncbi:unnamed protein product [Prorocentrum cordatum]|uniref:Uncharacterized protein n=1 Tax=Prorocentrum cordatum TaxID=2364126 RepID=A0ABN9R5Q6_9DINO|nr:unnamed protein product [Polarella glacialis]